MDKCTMGASMSGGQVLVVGVYGNAIECWQGMGNTRIKLATVPIEFRT